MSKFTREQTLAALREVIAENPGGRNRDCYYSEEEYMAVAENGRAAGVEHKTPLCIVARVDDKLGVFGFEPVATQVVECPDVWERYYAPTAVRLLAAVQSQADHYDNDGLHTPWERALNDALEDDAA